MKFDEFVAKAVSDCINGRTGPGDWSAYAAGIRAEAEDVNAGRVNVPETIAGPTPTKGCGCGPGCRCVQVTAEYMGRVLRGDDGPPDEAA